MGSLKLKLTIAYHGARYKGWQVQKSGITVQQKVEEALKRFFPSVDRVHSSSRTDTGVHARGMVAHVEVQKDEFRIGELKLKSKKAGLILKQKPCGIIQLQWYSHIIIG